MRFCLVDGWGMRRVSRVRGLSSGVEAEMRFSIYTSVRVLILGFMASTMLAALVGQCAPNRFARVVMDHRQPWTVAQHVIDPARGRNLILQTGRDRQIDPDFGEGVSVDLLSVSPFVDSKGVREMIGRRRLVEGSGADSMAVRVELSRFSYPGAELIESRETEWMPNSMPAWDVRLERGIKTVFATGAGFLVRLDWTDDRGVSVSHKGHRIEWDIEPPIGDMTNIGEPVWVTDPRYPDRLIVNYWGRDSADDHHVGLAWVELNRERSAITDYGILIQRNLGLNKNGISLRSPSVRIDISGNLHVMWMERLEGVRHWSLFKAELTDGPRDRSAGNGWMLAGVEEVADKCMPVPAYLDEDLRYAYFVVPKSISCYDGGQWRKAFVGESQSRVALRRGTAGAHGFETVSRR